MVTLAGEFEKMEVVVATNGVNLNHNGVKESSVESCWLEEKKPVEATSLSSGSSDIEEEESSVGSPKRVSNKKRKRSKADAVKKASIAKSPRKNRTLKKRSGDDERKCEVKNKKQRSSVNKRVKKEEEVVVDDEKNWEQEHQLVPFIKSTSRHRSKNSDIWFGNEIDNNASCSRSESDLSDSHLKNENFNDCRSMTRSLKVTFVLYTMRKHCDENVLTNFV